MSKIIKSLITVFLSITIFIVFQNARAQSLPIFLASWKAYNFIPPGFIGKALPLAEGTPVEVAFEIIQNGKIVDISKNDVKLFANNKKKAEGFGVRRFRFVTDGSRAYEIKINVLDSRGDIQFEHRFVIPAASPEIAVSYSYPRNTIKAGVNVFQIIPYFFNISRINDLRFSWAVNGAAPEATDKNPDQLEIAVPNDYPKNAAITISAAAQNNLRELEVANQTVTMTVK